MCVCVNSLRSAITYCRSDILVITRRKTASFHMCQVCALHIFRVFVSCSALFFRDKLVLCVDTAKHATDVRSRVSELCLELRCVPPCPWIWSGTSAWRSRFPRSSQWWWWWPYRYDIKDIKSVKIFQSYDYKLNVLPPFLWFTMYIHESNHVNSCSDFAMMMEQ